MTPNRRNSASDRRRHLLEMVALFGLIAMMVGAALPLLVDTAPWMRVAFAAGAVLVLVARLAEPRYPAGQLRLRRLQWLGVVSALLYCAAAATTFLHPGTSDWVALLLAGAVMQMYVGIVTDKELARNNPTAHGKQ